MSSPIIKIKLQSGGRQIEIEGAPDEVHRLLDKWWDPPAGEPASSDGETGKTGDGSARRRSRQTAPRTKKSNSDAEGKASSFDVNAFANKLKEHEDFAIFDRKIIRVERDWNHKIAFVLWITDQPLTSGQIHRALAALDIRGSLPTISKTLADNIGDFLTSETRKPGAIAEYRLSAPAKAVFETWLNDNSK